MPSKIQFDQLATSWINTDESVGETPVDDRVMRQTYRLNFDQCVANNCKRNCVGNPRCLSALRGYALAKATQNKLNDSTDPKSRETRDLSEPAGLKNLGATCYLNSLLQVWFHNTKFRDIILKWNRELDNGEQHSLGFDLPETIVGHIQLIFARLLRSIRRSVDPTALVEVLGLDAEYQQDASECCSLLFNVILDQLRMYGDGSIAKELADAYRGKQVTVIRCENCGAIKKCQQDFYNLILNVQGHRDVRQCIRSLGQSRKIEGDFTCGTCASKKGAVTYEEFTEMPSVLNLQLMRYRYDAKSGTKKKVQTVLRFPEVLDLRPHMKELKGDGLYELRAVLVHVGHSANSGHYIANVRKSDGGFWFRLNDENVSAMKGRPDLSAEAEGIDEKDVAPKKNGCKNGKSKINGNGVRVKREDGEHARQSFSSASSNCDEAMNEAVVILNECMEPSADATTQTLKGKRISSKSTEKNESDVHTFSSTGAYMLVYERVTAKPAEQTEDSTMNENALHNYLEEIIEREHKENTKLAEEIESIRSLSTSKAQELVTDFQAIFNELPYKADTDYRFVATTNLTRVIKKAERLFKSICNTIEQPKAVTGNPEIDSTSTQLEGNSAGFSCVHGNLNPEASALAKLKVISTTAASLVDDFCTKYGFSEIWHRKPDVPQKLCRECVIALGRRVAQLSQLVADNKAFTSFMKTKSNEKMFWVHNKDLQNWLKLAECQILTAVTGNDSGSLEAASETFNDKLRCVHGNLIIENKKSVPEEAWNILKKYFPLCAEYPTSVPECDKCRNESLAEEAIALERAGAASVLRQSLKNLMKFRQSLLQSETEAFAIHTNQAMSIRKYLRALTRPLDIPTNLPNALICSHDKSLVLVKDGALSGGVVLLTAEECDVLRENFSTDSFVRIQRDGTSVEVTPTPCEVCLERKMLEDEKAQMDFHNVEISVVKLPLEELIQKHSTLMNPKNAESDDNSSADKLEPLAKKPRLGRNSRVPNAKTIHISSTETFVDLKVKVMAKHHITPILQVFLIGDKLFSDLDGGTEIKELGIKADSILYVAEDVIRENESDTEKKKNIKEEIGFGGTKLMG